MLGTDSAFPIHIPYLEKRARNSIDGSLRFSAALLSNVLFLVVRKPKLLCSARSADDRKKFLRQLHDDPISCKRCNSAAENRAIGEAVLREMLWQHLGKHVAL